MSIASKPMADAVFQKLIASVNGLWEAAFILDRDWKEKKPYAEKVLEKAIENIKEIDKDYHRYVWVKEMEHLYGSKVSFKTLKKYVSMIRKGEYKKAIDDLDKVSTELRSIYAEKNARGSYI